VGVAHRTSADQPRLEVVITPDRHPAQRADLVDGQVAELLGQVPIDNRVSYGGESGVPVVEGAPASEQARVLTEARDRVILRSPQGEAVAEIDPQEAAIVRRWRARRDAPAANPVPGATVQEHLRALQAEWERTGGLDREYAVGYMRQLRERGAE